MVQFNMDEQIHEGTTWRAILASLLFSNGRVRLKVGATLLLDRNRSNGRVRLKVLSRVLINVKKKRNAPTQDNTLFLYIFSTFLSLYRPIFVLDSKTSTFFSCVSFCSSTKISMQYLQDLIYKFFWIFEPVVKVVKDFMIFSYIYQQQMHGEWIKCIRHLCRLNSSRWNPIWCTKPDTLPCSQPWHWERNLYLARNIQYMLKNVSDYL